MNFKDQVEIILQTRKKNLEQILEREKDINRLRSNLNDIKSLLEKSNDEGLASYSSEITKIENSIKDSIASLGILKKRFSRDTVNLGVAGIAKVGKSTFLQVLSGLGSEQIPSGDSLCTIFEVVRKLWQK